MTDPGLTFAQLRQLLLDMNFTETVTPRSHVFFAHSRTGAEVALPIYRPTQVVLLVCSPKTGPGGMRVSEALRGQETNREASHG